MKVLWINEYLHSMGGSNSVCRSLIKEFVKTGVETHVASKIDPIKPYLEELQDVIHHEFGFEGNAIQGISATSAPFDIEIERFKQLILDENYDIVYLHCAGQSLFDLALFHLNIETLCKKVVLIPSGFSQLYIPEWQRYFTGLEIKLKSAKNIEVSCFSGNYRDSNWLKEKGIPFHVIPNGVHFEEFEVDTDTEFLANEGITEDDFVVLHVGTMTTEKGHIDAWRMFDLAFPDKTNKKLIFATTGVLHPSNPIYSEIRQCTNNSGFPNSCEFILTDRIGRKGLIQLYNRADLFLFPSYIEASPLVVLEAIASRTFVMATDVGNTKELIQTYGAGGIIETNHDNNSAYGRSLPNINNGTFHLKEMAHYNSGTGAPHNWHLFKQERDWATIAKQYLSLAI